MRSKAATVAEYLATVPPEQKQTLSAVRAALKRSLPKGYVETMQSGMISYVVPLSTFPDGYLGDTSVPLPYASLAAHKSYSALYLMGVYGDPELERWFRRAYAESGKKLDMGKSCVRFRTADELALDVIGAVLAQVPVSAYVNRYLAARGTAKKTPARSRSRSRG
ncbi:MAG TPA: DUF1801 domain-containing protein [Polyangiaceae bacterium]|nr:DUF1801 domain-containing protein [Polyangiaceae bacterium]